MNNTCLSGGADGADLQWGMCAGKAGHHVVHWSFEGHRSKAPEAEISILTKDQLEEAHATVARANATLKRHYPAKNWFVNSLLRRNYYQVKWAESLYAVASLEEGKVSGGTAWAVQMYMDRFLIDGEPLENCQLYLFDQITNRWFRWFSTWVEADSVPMPSGVWAGIGSRELTEQGKAAIRSLMQYEAKIPN